MSAELSESPHLTERCAVVMLAVGRREAAPDSAGWFVLEAIS